MATVNETFQFPEYITSAKEVKIYSRQPQEMDNAVRMVQEVYILILNFIMKLDCHQNPL